MAWRRSGVYWRIYASLGLNELTLIGPVCVCVGGGGGVLPATMLTQIYDAIWCHYIDHNQGYFIGIVTTIHMIVSVPVNQPWRTWVYESYESTENY